ncbi:MAG: hypothetical protein HFG20_09060 [Anaerotruncus sp.]|nr:hypothetical protein [Anaerotruncus sp.]
MVCRKCGSNVKTDFKFCPYCGERVVSDFHGQYEEMELDLDAHTPSEPSAESYYAPRAGEQVPDFSQPSQPLTLHPEDEIKDEQEPLLYYSEQPQQGLLEQEEDDSKLPENAYPQQSYSEQPEDDFPELPADPYPQQSYQEQREDDFPELPADAYPSQADQEQPEDGYSPQERPYFVYHSDDPPVRKPLSHSEPWISWDDDGPEGWGLTGAQTQPIEQPEMQERFSTQRPEPPSVGGYREAPRPSEQRPMRRPPANVRQRWEEPNPLPRWDELEPEQTPRRAVQAQTKKTRPEGPNLAVRILVILLVIAAALGVSIGSYRLLTGKLPLPDLLSLMQAGQEPSTAQSSASVNSDVAEMFL